MRIQHIVGRLKCKRCGYGTDDLRLFIPHIKTHGASVGDDSMDFANKKPYTDYLTGFRCKYVIGKSGKGCIFV